MIAAGVPEAQAIDNAGVHTIKLSGGHLHDTLIPERGDRSDNPCDGTYRVSGDRYTFRWDDGTPCTGNFTGTWSVSGADLRFRDVRGVIVDRALWGLKPFRKIG